MLKQLDMENADRDISSLITVLTNTPDISNPTWCQGYIELGYGAKTLDGSGGNFELVITVGGFMIQPSPQVVIFGTEVRSAVWTTPFPVPANAAVILRVKSPNGADSDVDVMAYLYDLSSEADIITALKASVGYTAGGTSTFAECVKIMTAWAAGKWQDKSGSPGTQQVLDADDGATVILEVSPSLTTPYKVVSIP